MMLHIKILTSIAFASHQEQMLFRSSWRCCSTDSTLMKILISSANIKKFESTTVTILLTKQVKKQRAKVRTLGDARKNGEGFSSGAIKLNNEAAIIQITLKKPKFNKPQIPYPWSLATRQQWFINNFEIQFNY